MKGYRNAFKILMIAAAVVLVATVSFTLWHGLTDRGVLVKYGPSSSAPTEDTADYPININTATKEQLMKLDGIGEKRAEDIIAYRQSVGRIDNVDELLKVDGIGQKTLDGIREYICVE